MDPFEYLVTFVSIVVGLAVGDLATSLHRLIRAGRAVRWDWLPLATAALATLLILNAWWGFYRVGARTDYTVFGEFLPVAAPFAVLFLLASAALPDEVGPEGLDLRAFYDANRRYFWGLMAAYHVATVFDDAVARGIESLLQGLPNLALAGFFVALAVVRARRFHEASVVVVLGLYLWAWWGMRLAA
ncbi:MAG TPA: hypothetical protein VF576_03905 [Rubricoccaceae bacterium]